MTSTTTTPAALAEQYDLQCAADLPPRPKPPEDHAAVRARWPADVRAEFKRMSPHALCVVATDGPLSMTLYDALGGVRRRLGHNRGFWPVRLATTGQWKDAVTTTYNRFPCVFLGTQIRVWCRTDAHEMRLAHAVAEAIGVLAEHALGVDLDKGFSDVGPEFSLKMFEMEVHALAERLGLETWDDDGLKRELEWRARMQSRLEPRSRLRESGQEKGGR